MMMMMMICVMWSQFLDHQFFKKTHFVFLLDVSSYFFLLWIFCKIKLLWNLIVNNVINRVIYLICCSFFFWFVFSFFSWMKKNQTKRWGNLLSSKCWWTLEIVIFIFFVVFVCLLVILNYSFAIIFWSFCLNFYMSFSFWSFGYNQEKKIYHQPSFLYLLGKKIESKTIKSHKSHHTHKRPDIKDTWRKQRIFLIFFVLYFYIIIIIIIIIRKKTVKQ